jgi:AcrR family transcriptional regulator
MSIPSSWTGPVAPAKALRKDGARNRALLVEAARAVFAERGLDATLDDVAKAAGVGVGTAYRHFANKQELARELMAQSFGLLVEDAQAALLVADPWEALSGFLEVSATRLVRDRGLHQAMFGPAAFEKAPMRPDLVAAVLELFARAKAAGVLRPDVEAMDVVPLYAMMGVASDIGSVVGPQQWRRSLAFFLDGMRAIDRPQLTTPAIPIDRLEDALAATKPRRR